MEARDTAPSPFLSVIHPQTILTPLRFELDVQLPCPPAPSALNGMG